MNPALAAFLVKFEAAIINPLITLLALGGFVLFAWGIVQFVINAGDDHERQEGRQKIIWGLVGLVIIFGAKAILALALNTFGIASP